ncbi:MAG: MFS transporter [Desulfurococcales archaeon]|nr:MFS transporter [Desulfurococcales archaeon]
MDAVRSEGRRVLKGVWMFTVIRGVGMPGFMYLYPLYILTLGYHTADLGPIATYAALISALLLPLIGYLTDSGHASEVGIVAGSSTVLSLLLPALIPTYPILILSYALSYLGMMSWQVSRGSLTAKIVSSSTLGKHFGLLAALYNVMNIVTPFALGLLLTFFTYKELLIYLSIFMVAGTSGFAAIVLPPARNVEETHRAEATSQGVRDEWLECRGASGLRKGVCIYRKALLIDKRVIPLALFGILDRYGWMLWMPMINAYLKEYLGFEDMAVSWFNTLRGVGMLVSALPAGHIADVLGAVQVLILNEFIGASSVAALLTSSPPIIYLAAFVMGWSMAFWVTGYNTITATILGPRNMGRVRSGVDSLRTYFSVPAPMIGSAIFRGIGTAAPFAFGAVLMVSAALPLIAGMRRGWGRLT